MTRATIDGCVYEFAEGVSILQAALSVDIKVPTLCHDPALKPIGACCMCLVQVKGVPTSVDLP